MDPGERQPNAGCLTLPQTSGTLPVWCSGPSRTAQGDDSCPQGAINQCTAFTLKRLLTFKTHTHADTLLYADTRVAVWDTRPAFQDPGERKKALFWAQLTFSRTKLSKHTVLQHTMSCRLAVQYVGDVVFAQSSFKGAANPKEAAPSGLNPPLSAIQTEASE